MQRTGWQKPLVRGVTTFMTVAVLIMIFCFSMEDAEQSDSRSDSVSRIVIRLFHPDYEELDAGSQLIIYERVQYTVRKLAHAAEFTILGFLIRLCLESWFGHKAAKYRILSVTGCGFGVVYACTDEIHQRSIAGRSGQWTDVLVDSFGVLTGVTLGTLLIRSLNRKTDEESVRKTSRE